MHPTIIVIAAMLAPVWVNAQSAVPGDSADARRQLLRIEDDIGRANRTCDYAYFRRVEAAEFIYTGPNGGVTTRDDNLAGEKDCRPRNYAQVIDEPRVMVYGSFAVVNARNTITIVSASGQPVVHRTRFTDVFVWRDGRWQLISGHASRIAE